nr:nuclear pore complex protein NUP62 [Ipomoea batatas]
MSTGAATGTSPKLPSEITGKTIEEVIKEWNAELQERTTNFRKQANAIAEWDRRILQNRDILLKLESEVAKVVETQASLERQLELIETHQDEVDKALQSMEEEAERIYKDEREMLLDDEAAYTRDAMYEQAEFVEREMEKMMEQIKSIINSLNANQGGEITDGVNPLDVVVRILNNQLSSLVWIDEKVITIHTVHALLFVPGFFLICLFYFPLWTARMFVVYIFSPIEKFSLHRMAFNQLKLRRLIGHSRWESNM